MSQLDLGPYICLILFLGPLVLGAPQLVLINELDWSVPSSGLTSAVHVDTPL